MNYPFTAIVGQQKLKKALLLSAINPAIGGVLIRGDKGTAKSTAARALAALVPLIIKTEGCRYNCSELNPLAICEVCSDNDSQRIETIVPFINLPLGATEERVLGSLDLEGVLKDKKKRLLPGLLASAHLGILYIDEVNLLSDHLVDILLDVAAMGVNTIERDGLSLSHPSRFTLIGSMNVEEGNLRPQFLDRFGLMVDVEAPKDVQERTLVVRRRIAFEADPATFVLQWQTAEMELRERLVTAKDLLKSVQLSDHLLTRISEICTGMGVKSLRADIVMYKTAITLAALDARTEVTENDIREAANLVLAHRSANSHSPEQSHQQKLDEILNNSEAASQAEKPNPADRQTENSDSFDAQDDADQGDISAEQNEKEQIFAPGVANQPVKIGVQPNALINHAINNGQRTKVKEALTGRYTRTEMAKPNSQIAIDASVLKALQRNPDEFSVNREDLVQKAHSGKTGNLIVFIVDASGSMAANKRMETVKGTVLALLKDAYQRRDEVCVIAFRGIEAKILLQPTRSVELAEQALSKLPTGGRTPLPHAIQTAIQLMNSFGTQKTLQPFLVFLSDGKANVTLSGGDPWHESLSLAAELKNRKTQALLINTDIDYLKLGRAEQLASALGAEYLSLTEISSDELVPVITNTLHN